MPFLLFLLSGLCEPSSYAGLGLIAQGVHSLASGGATSTAGASIIAGVAALMVPEGADAAARSPAPSPNTRA